MINRQLKTTETISSPLLRYSRMSLQLPQYYHITVTIPAKLLYPNPVIITAGTTVLLHSLLPSLVLSFAVSSRFLACFLTCYTVSIMLCLRLILSTVHNLSLPLYRTITHLFPTQSSPSIIFTARAYARAVLGVVILSIRLSRLSVRPSVTRVHCDKTK